jgi:hypothetical protein
MISFQNNYYLDPLNINFEDVETNIYNSVYSKENEDFLLEENNNIFPSFFEEKDLQELDNEVNEFGLKLLNQLKEETQILLEKENQLQIQIQPIPNNDFNINCNNIENIILENNENINNNFEINNNILNNNNKTLKKRGRKRKNTSNNEQNVKKIKSNNINNGEKIVKRKRLYSFPLMSWLKNNAECPYPSESVKEKLAKDANITRKQLDNWFVNARKRYLKKILNSDTPITHKNKKNKKVNTNLN